MKETVSKIRRDGRPLTEVHIIHMNMTFEDAERMSVGREEKERGMLEDGFTRPFQQQAAAAFSSALLSLDEITSLVIINE